MADDWERVTPEANDDWEPVSRPDDGPLPQRVVAQAGVYANSPAETEVAKQNHEGILDKFGEGFREGWGPERLGLSDESIEWLQKTKMFRDPGERFGSPFKAFNETIGLAGAATLDAIARLPSAVYRGLQSAGVEAGLPRDVVSIPEAFLGSAHPTSIPKPFVKPVKIKPLEGSPNPGVARTVAAKTGDPLIDAILDHPTLKQVIDNPVVDDSHTIPNSLGGSTPVENPTLYRDKDFPKQMTVERADGNGSVTFDTADPSAVHENVEEAALDMMTKGGMDQATALKVAFWEFGEKAEDAWYAAHGMDPVKVEEKYTAELNKIASRTADDVPPDLFKGTYPDSDPAKAGPGPIDKPTPEEVAQGRSIIAKHLGLDKEPPAHFTGGTGGPIDLRVASDLGVIGEKPAVEGTPAQKASAAIQPITAYHGSPYSFDAFDIGKIGEGEGAQKFGPGLYFAENEDVARSYLKAGSNQTGVGIAERALRNFGTREAAIASLENKLGPFEPPWYQEAINLLSDHDWLPQNTLYQVRIHIDRDALLDWDKGLRGQSPEVDAALKRFAKLATKEKDGLKPQSAFMAEDGNPDVDSFRKQIEYDFDPFTAAILLREAGIPGIKYLDQGSRNTGLGTRNFVIFDHNDVEITHKNGEPVQQAAPRTMAAEGVKDEKITQEVGTAKDAWRQRFDESVGKLKTGEDIKQLIKDAADAQEDFPAARAGDVPLAHVEAIADAAGVDPASVNARGLGRQFKTDAEVRLAYQAMIKLTENVKEAARNHRDEPSEKSRIALQEALMRRDAAVEQVVGFRAEWGRVGNTIQEFMERVKNQEQLSDFLNEQGRGRTPKDLDKIADTIDAMDRNGGNVPGFLNDARKPGFADKLFWYWQNQLISGWLTHTKYAGANATYLLWNRGVVTPLARAMEVRSLKDAAHLPFEALTGIAGSISATPMAFMTAIRSVKTGLRVPLEGETELARLATEKGEPIPKFAARPFTPNQRPISGGLGRIIGAPGDAANAIHTFFRIIGYEGEMQAQAYRAAQDEGHMPMTQQFWDRQQQIRANATEEMMQAGIDVANKGTFIQESGPRAKAFQRFTRETPGMRWVFPFTHIPLNLMKATVEITPAAPLSAEVRAELKGERGAQVQHTAIARMVAGSALMGWVVNKALNDEMTGDYPNDPKDRDQWKLQGKQPNSILIGDKWVSFNKFGPIGDLMGVGATMGQAIPHLKSEDNDEMEKATWYLAQAGARIVTEEVGMMSLQMMFEAMKDDKKATTFIASMASSFTPASSFLGQSASFMDPDMRQAKTIIDGFKYRIPLERETLLPKRDWSGVPVPNPQYGNLLRQTQAQADPIDLEMARLGIHPAPPQDRIGGVKLPPGMYDKYHANSAPLTRMMLGGLINSEGWNNLPPGVREDVIHKTIAAARKSAASAMQMSYPQIIQQGVDDKVAKITGAKKTKLQEPAPSP